MRKAKKDDRRIVTHTVTIEFKSCGALRLTNKELLGIERVYLDCIDVERDKVPPEGDFAVITSVHAKKD